MLLRNSSRPANVQKKLSGAELEEFVEQWVDKLLDPSTPLLRTAVLAGLAHPELAKVLARMWGFPTDVYGSAFADDVNDALQSMDRKKLVALAKAKFTESPPTEEQAQQLAGIDLGRLMREALQHVSRQFTGRRGRKPKARTRDYPKIAALGDKLYPVCFRLVTEEHFNKLSSVPESLGSLKRQHPEACTFLLHHLTSFELALKDESLRKRAAGIEARARLLSDAIAGADYNLKFRTSIVRAREGRRSKGRAHS